MTDGVPDIQRAFVILHDRCDIRFGTLLGAFIRFAGGSVTRVAEEAGVTPRHIQSCMYGRAIASTRVRDSLSGLLGFDPWAVVAHPNGNPSYQHVDTDIHYHEDHDSDDY